LKQNRSSQFVPKIRLVSSIDQFPDIEVPIDPYVLGVLIGDGHLGHGTKISSQDEEIITEISKRLVEGYRIKYRSKYDYDIVGNAKSSGKLGE